MITDFGKQLRKIRIDEQELLADMAQKLGVSSAYLSAVETGKRNIPDAWLQKIISVYKLPEERAQTLTDSFFYSKPVVKIELSQATEQQKTTALSFAKALDGLSDSDLEKIMTVVNKVKSRGR